MEQTEYLDQYEQLLMNNLLKMLTDLKLLDGRLLETPDITDLWDDRLAATYCADAVPEIAKYPSVALAWAMYVGMGVAKYWDEDWSIYSRVDNLYLHMRDKRGFDCLDEYVRFELLQWDCEDRVRSCAQMALDQLRHEQVPPQSPLAFHIYARSIRVLYRIGAAMALKHLGYKLEKI